MAYFGRGALRAYFYQAQMGKCHYCHAHMTMQSEGAMICTVEHKKPRSQGGDNRLGNLVGACLLCNNMRGTIDYWVFKEYIQVYGNARSMKVVLKSISREKYQKHEKMWSVILADRTDLRQFVPPNVRLVVPYAGRRPWLVKTRLLLANLYKKGNANEWVSNDNDDTIRSEPGGNGLSYLGQWVGIGNRDLQRTASDNETVLDYDGDLSPSQQ